MLIKADRATVEAHQHGFWPAAMARDRFGMEPAISWVAVLGVALFAHDEPRHGRARAIVRNAVHDAQARSAMRTIGKWVAVAPCERVNDFLRACRADRSVRRHFRMRHSAGALRDTKRIRQHIEKEARLHPVDACERRRLELYPADEGSDCRFPSANADEDAIRIVQYFARKTKFPRVAPDRRAKSDALYPSPNADLDCNDLLRCGAARVQIHRTTSHRGTPLLPKPVMTKVSPQQAGRCHDYPKPFVWTASSTAILEKVAVGAKC